jgi:hypothetical protein
VVRSPALIILAACYCGCQLELPALSEPAGREYFVDADQGDDGGPGSAARPWRTVARVNDAQLLPGDSVFFRRGQTWAETLHPPASGAAERPIVFASYGSGARPALTGEPSSGCIAWSEPRSHLVFRDLHLKDCGKPDGVRQGGISIWSEEERSRDITVEDCLVQGSQSWALFAAGVQGLTLRNNTFNGGESSVLNIGSLSTRDVVIENNELFGTSESCIYLAAIRSVTIARNTLHDCTVAGVNNVGASSLTMHHNVLYDLAVGVYNACDRSIPTCASGGSYQHNTFVVNGDWCACVSSAPESDYREFSSNICHHRCRQGPLVETPADPPAISDYNVYFGSQHFSWGGRTYDTFESFVNGSASAEHSVFADPRFVDEENDDFHLADGSPALDLAPSSPYERDHDGAPIPAKSGVDAGAFEQQ